MGRGETEVSRHPPRATVPILGKMEASLQWVTIARWKAAAREKLGSQAFCHCDDRDVSGQMTSCQPIPMSTQHGRDQTDSDQVGWCAWRARRISGLRRVLRTPVSRADDSIRCIQGMHGARLRTILARGRCSGPQRRTDAIAGRSCRCRSHPDLNVIGESACHPIPFRVR